MRNWERFTKTNVIMGLVAGLAMVFALTAGSCDNRGQGDAPVGRQHEDDREVWNSPDAVNNVYAYCIGANGAYLNTNHRLVMVKSDPNCEEGGELNDDGK